MGEKVCGGITGRKIKRGDLGGKDSVRASGLKRQGK